MALTISRTARQIKDWHERGLLDDATAQTLIDDIGSFEKTRSFSTVAVWLGIICLAFGAMTFVAANWDYMPRFLRMAVLMGGVLASYILAAVLHRRGQTSVAEAFVVLGCGVFGAAVMLTGQMYHLSGPPSGGVLIWALGSFVAAVVTGSQGALGLTVILLALWTGMSMTVGNAGAFHGWFVPFWTALAGYVWWIRARWVAHLCAMALLVWLGVSLVRVIGESGTFTAGYLTIMVSFAAISWLIASARTIKLMRGFEGAAVFYFLVLIFGAMIFLYIWREIEYAPETASYLVYVSALLLAGLALAPIFLREERFDHILAAIWVGVTALVAYMLVPYLPMVIEAYALAVSIWTIRMGGRQGWGSITSLGYFAFAVTMFVIYATAANGLLETSLFYLGAGLLLLIGAVVVPRLVPKREGAQ